MAERDYPPVRVTKETHRRLKALAEAWGASMGRIVEVLLNREEAALTRDVHDPLIVAMREAGRRRRRERAKSSAGL